MVNMMWVSEWLVQYILSRCPTPLLLAAVYVFNQSLQDISLSLAKSQAPACFFSCLFFNQTGQTSVLMLWSGCLFTLERSPLQLSETHPQPLPPQVVISVLPGRRILKVCPDPTYVIWLIFNVKMKQSNDLRPWWTQCEQSLNPETDAN